MPSSFRRHLVFEFQSDNAIFIFEFWSAEDFVPEDQNGVLTCAPPFWARGNCHRAGQTSPGTTLVDWPKCSGYNVEKNTKISLNGPSI